MKKMCTLQKLQHSVLKNVSSNQFIFVLVKAPVIIKFKLISALQNNTTFRFFNSFIFTQSSDF